MNVAELYLEPGRDDYPDGFWIWIRTDEGKQIWHRFERAALRMAKKRSRYSARSIIHVLRWNTALRDGTEFKINNNWSSGMARLWMRKHGDKHPGFFTLRDAIGRDLK